jgi:uncharacterized protein YukE
MFLQFVRSGVEQVMSGISQQQQITTAVLDTVKSYVPTVQQAWTGNDANEFAADIARKYVPANLELIAAIAGVNLNLTKSTNIVDQADNESKKAADELGQEFGQV